MKILGTGLSGLVGSRIVELLEDKIEFDFSEIDITDKDKITSKIRDSKALIVLHLAAKTDVDACEKDKAQGKRGPAWQVNVIGTQNVALACQASGKKMIYMSTDFVFDGNPKDPRGYTEEDSPDPINWYGKTKYEGELIVQSLKTPFLIVRLAYPYRVSFQRPDFVRTIINRLKTRETVNTVTDHMFTPTFIDDIAEALRVLVEQNETGIFHVVGSQFLSPYKAAHIICQKFGFDVSLVSSTTREEYFKNRAPRPEKLALLNDKIKKLGVRMRTLDEGLDEFQESATIRH
ncbi:MAG: SDR family oxidoreductase [Candidatus Levybacteria bacterium]|nr:SDR family oxidoreductase [Candidatus Levybacteria bacterium]